MDPPASHTIGFAHLISIFKGNLRAMAIALIATRIWEILANTL